MANKLPWFTHDHDAHEDLWIRNLVKKQGHVAGWLWWVLLELHHKHGVVDKLKIETSDVAKAALTSNSVVDRVLTEMATEFQGQLKLRLNRVGTVLELEIPNFRKRQRNLKSKATSTPNESHSNARLQEEGQVEEERDNGLTTLQAAKNKTLLAQVLDFVAWKKRVPFKKPYNGVRR